MIVSVLLAAALAGTVIAFMRYQREQNAQWAAERRELLNRIQRPEHVPLVAPVGWVAPELEDDEINLVGAILDPPPETP